MDYSNGNKLNQQGSNLENQGQNFSNIPPQNSIRNLKIIIGVLVVLLVGALGVAGYYIFGNKNISQTEQPTPTQATNAPKSNPTPTPHQRIRQQIGKYIVILDMLIQLNIQPTGLWTPRILKTILPKEVQLKITSL